MDQGVRWWGLDGIILKISLSPQSLEDKRTRFKVPLRAVTIDWLKSELLQLEAEHDLAMESVLSLGGRTVHIPMIDFASSPSRKMAAVAWMKQNNRLKFHFFESGRSLHAYGIDPVSQRNWVRLMGLLLLSNLPDQPPIVDTRWIGHRLMAGYSSLRWSKNSSRYLAQPTLIRD